MTIPSKDILVEAVDTAAEELAAIADLSDAGALDRLLSEVEANPNYPDLRYQLSRRYLLAGRPEDALRQIDRALAINGRFLDALRLKTRILTDRGDLRAALQTCKRVNALDPTSSEGYLAEAVLHARLGDHAAAIGAGRNAVELLRSNVDAHLLLGEEYLRLDEPRLARRHFEIASRLGPNDEASYLAGLVSLQEGDAGSAEASFARTLEVNAKHRNAAVRLSLLKVASGDYVEGHRILSAILEQYPTYPDLWYGLARVCVLMGRHDEAYRCMKTALELNPRYAEARQGLAQLCEGKDDSEAAYHASVGIEIDPMDDQAIVNLASIHSKQGEHDKAVEVLERAVNRFPDSWRILQTLGILHLQRKAYPKARVALAGAAEIRPELASIERSLRIVFYDESLLDDERGKLEAEYPGDEERPALHHHLGRLYLDFHKEKLAGQFFEQSYQAGYAATQNSFLLSLVYGNRSDYGTAIRWLASLALTGLAENARRILLGLFHANLGEHETSTRFYQQAMTDLPLFLHALGGVCVSFREREEVEDMLDDYLDYARYNDRNAPLLCRIGTAYAAKGMLVEAKRQFDHATVVDSSHGESFHNLGLLSLLRLDFDEAARQFRQAIERSPDWPLPHLALSLVEYERKNRTAAMMSLQRYIFVETTDCWRELAEQRLEAWSDPADARETRSRRESRPQGAV